ncbi:hypothetical protein QOZ80_5BG0453980 [Eleusine coracana subsp. coracana]|nr:hypothetical protein QOZ80_5BG0453980 [Eleusine coracana subsp. coracana]
MAGVVVLCHVTGVHPPSLAVFWHFFSIYVSNIKVVLLLGQGRRRRAHDGDVALAQGVERGVLLPQVAYSVAVAEPSKSATAEPVLGRTEKNMAAKLLRAHDLKTCLCESILAAGMIAGAPPTTVLPRSPHTVDGSKGIDPAVYDMMKRMRAEKVASAEKKVAVKSLGSFQTQKKPWHDGDTAEWEVARQLLQGIVTPSREWSFTAARPSGVIASSYVTVLQVRR